jgi:hypothetical protein
MQLSDVARTGTLGTANQGAIERYKRRAGRRAGEAQGVDEFDSTSCQIESAGHGRFIFGLHVLEAEQFRESIHDCGILKSVKAAQHPTSFQQDSLCDPDWTGSE